MSHVFLRRVVFKDVGICIKEQCVRDAVELQMFVVQSLVRSHAIVFTHPLTPPHS